MFETLFKYLNVLARHSEGPAAEERRRFLIHRANEGAARNTLRQTANELLVIAKNINVTIGKTCKWAKAGYDSWDDCKNPYSHRLLLPT